MSDIEVGEYIRTKGGYIGKVEHITKGYKFKTTTGHIATGQERYLLDNRKSISKPYVTKHSKNILDLIEKGDIVNNERVKRIHKGIGQQYIVLEGRNIFSEDYKDIETILTHEQYEQNCYKVGDIE